ncbi:hypothetical protein [Pedobacter hiemivivus]|uniref:Uncharacterized protein n=1 Tax=Pedobacter hiemivivus TaxID=2530454 RepID=A0A4R0NBR5_9SPHI|nr:hypothetical protein [Pedobacter hiemivivus]TCC97720.1 hypothetical protein EZ444_07340 [Pedobacter hiemivivus]
MIVFFSGIGIPDKSANDGNQVRLVIIKESFYLLHRLKHSFIKGSVGAFSSQITTSVSGKTHIISKADNALADAIGLGTYGLDLAGAAVLLLGESQTDSILAQTDGSQITGSMGASFQAAKSVIALGVAISTKAEPRSSVLPWYGYSHFVIYLKNGKIFAATSLLITYLDLPMEEEK